MSRFALALLAVLLVACSNDDDPTPSPDAGAEDAAQADGNSDAAADPWATVDAMVARAVADNGVPGLGLAVYDEHDTLRFQRIYGDFAPDRRVAVASASKLVSGLVLFDVIARGHLSLDDTTGAVLRWSGPQAAITLRHLLSFTSGLPPSNPCTASLTMTLGECVAQIATTALVAPPGTRFDYGSTHLHVAARMAEVKTGKLWSDLFRSTLADPLRLPALVRYYSAPRQSIGLQNPLIAGGLRASMAEYAPLLALAFHKGSYAGVEIATPALFDEQAREPFPSVTIGNSPAKSVGFPARYGLASWLECDTPATGCQILSSPGAFGWTPWYDREHGYYAILGMELAGTDTSGIVSFSVHLEQSLEPAIVAALGR